MSLMLFWCRAVSIEPWISNLLGWSTPKSLQNSIFITGCFTSLAHCTNDFVSNKLN